eukprot:9494816-Pyramimonas_sp.AAC.1
MFPRARARWTDATSNVDAWSVVLAQARRHPLAMCHPTDILGKALAAYAAFGISTSGVEQDFSKGDQIMGSKRLSCRPGTEELVVKLGLDLPGHDIKKLIPCAQR